MRSFQIEIVTPDGPAFSGNVESLLVRTDDGDVEILAGHTDLLASIGTGRVRITESGKQRFASVNGGFLTVMGGKVFLCAITFEFADQIDVARASEAKARAEAVIASAADEQQVRIARAKLARAASRLNVADMK